jgi:hypothetical protein
MAELIGHFDIDIDRDKDYRAQQKAVIEKCSEYVAKLPLNGRDAPLVGRVVKFQVADGYAEYMVACQKPLQLLHIGTGDYYQIPAAHMRGLIVEDIEDEDDERLWS